MWCWQCEHHKHHKCRREHNFSLVIIQFLMSKFGQYDWLNADQRCQGNTRVELESTQASPQRSWCYACASVILWTDLNWECTVQQYLCACIVYVSWPMHVCMCTSVHSVCVCIVLCKHIATCRSQDCYHCYSIQVAPFASQNNIPRLLQSVAKIRNMSSTLWKVTHHQNDCFSSVFAISHPHTQAVREFLHCNNFSECLTFSNWFGYLVIFCKISLHKIIYSCVWLILYTTVSSPVC